MGNSNTIMSQNQQELSFFVILLHMTLFCTKICAKVLNLDYEKPKLKSSFQKFYKRHQELIHLEFHWLWTSVQYHLDVQLCSTPNFCELSTASVFCIWVVSLLIKTLLCTSTCVPSVIEMQVDLLHEQCQLVTQDQSKYTTHKRERIKIKSKYLFLKLIKFHSEI